WNAETGALKQRITNVNTYQAPPVVFTPDSKHFVSLWTDGRLHLVETSSGKSVRNLQTAVLSGPTYSTRFTTAALTPDGKQLIYRHSGDRFYRGVDLGSGKEVRRWERTSGNIDVYTGAMAVTPNGRFLVESSG